MGHVSVLSKELIDGLSIQPHHTVVDCTINGGGHSELVTHILEEQGTLIGIDLDTEALSFSRERLAQAECSVVLKQGNYTQLDRFLDEEQIDVVDRFIFDLGMSSDQLDDSKRGFSFRFEEPLLMTFNSSPREGELSAREIVNEWEEEHIADILYGYGDEGFSRQIAKKIVEVRKEKPIKTTGDLVSIIIAATPVWYQKKRKNVATRTFQALRMTVNNEMENVKIGVVKAIDRLSPLGRVAVITFHSIEDRIIKNIFKQAQKEEQGIVLTKKPIVPSLEEVKNNPRARSAKLRIFQKHEA